MRYLTLSEILEIHRRVMQQSGGIGGIRDLGALESAIAQPRMTFGGEELDPTIVEKTAALGFPLIQNRLGFPTLRRWFWRVLSEKGFSQPRWSWGAHARALRGCSRSVVCA